ncbi:GNAT family N-acetyltransferase [Paenibacillus selenitireducens]|uniref:GNAT family N-acetyltransferase n=1 Tax=Paenibacillus selenitireducens TaxID=1324314 RepID=A0A1T2X6Q0_9BACL|nr:GNAT family N-acetyltransferase [Paenibacillus selenitireducens]OPA75561.1 GNAT family N-acetyltransferase [Paenibacillus selenitireducens]
MDVRSFQLSDYMQVTQLFEEALSETCYEQTMEAFARQLSWDSDLVLVHHQDGEVKGAIIGTIDNNHGCYYRLAVHPEARNQGVGKSLITAMQQRFEGRNVKKICIAGDEHNEPILPLFASMGFGAASVLQAFQKLRIVTG